jgi:hypothetical protein
VIYNEATKKWTGFCKKQNKQRALQNFTIEQDPGNADLSDLEDMIFSDEEEEDEEEEEDDEDPEATGSGSRLKRFEIHGDMTSDYLI